MTAMAQNSELMLFITHVETDGPLLKIWGQIDRNAATCVERMILPLSEKFAQGLGAPNSSYSLPPNVICCARFQNDGYYRAKICNVQPSGNVLVHFIDYGNFEVLPPTAIRLLDNIPSAASLHGLPPLALEFVLANVLPVNGIWDPETIESIKQSLRYADLKGILHSVVGSHRLLKLCYNNEDFGELLVSKNLAVSVTLQEMFAATRQPPRQHGTQFPREVRAQVPAGSYPHRPQVNTYAEPATRSNAAVQEDWRSSQHRQPPPHVPEALVFKSRVLDVGSVHDVYVSFVEDGPLKFSVQVKSTAAILSELMTNINKYPTAPLQEPPLPGSVCLGRYSLDKVLCRAVVMAVMEHKCKVYYVDFGHTEVLPYSDIFQLPPQYINPRVLSIRFTLSGLKDLDITEPIKEYFKKIVSGKPLVLQVRPPEGPPLIQYGDLYDGGINIRDLLKERCSTVAVPVFYQEPLVLKPGFKDIVHVSYVESCTKFFIQLDSRIKSLNSIMACLAEYAQKAPQLEEKRLKVGWPCCASYVEDQQWYRAKILSINGDQVTVLYVDYGNEETVAVSTLRKIHDDLVTNLGAQAIKCALNGFQSLVFNQDLANQFEALVLEKKLAMEVISTLPNNLMVVDLHDCSTAPMVNIATKLRIPSQLPRGTNSSNAHKDSEQILNTSRSPDAKHPSEERVSKWGRSGKPSSWSQDTRSGDWSARSNNYEERGTTKNVKDVENEQRQRESNRNEGDDRFHQKEIRNNHFNRNETSGNRFERGEDTGPRRGRGGRSGSGGGGVSRDDNRFDKNSSKDDSWSDRDSDTSSRSSGKRGGKGPRGIKGRGERGPRRGAERKPSTGKWSDGESDRGSQKSGQGSGFRSRERNSSNSNFKTVNKAQPNKSGSWNTMSPTSPVKSPVKFNAPRIPPPNITVGAVKNAEIIYMESPTNFYVQLCPDNMELDTLMEKIAQFYVNGGVVAKSSALQPGISCIAQYSGDSKWYRATIKTNSVHTANVHFIDYGNAEAVSHDKIKELQSEFAKLSTQAIHCKLFGAAKTTWTNAEIDTFSQCAEGLSLEAEFVAQTNGIYDVLIKVAGTDGDADYVNKKFCGDLDLNQAKKELKSNVRSGGKKKTRVTPQYISAGQKWTDESFTSGYQVDVVVTWFVNPNNFYCQILSKQSEFRNMMNEIQDSYVEQQPVKTPLQVGAPVIAFFSDDGALYRAEIKELNKLRGHIVQYVDFGNCAMVDPSKIYPVEKRFAVLPKQAMHCTLKDIRPVAGADWSKANKHEIDRYFDADKYRCTFHGTGDGKYSISLSDKGKDIGESIVAAGLAANSESQAKAVVAKVSTTEPSPPSANLQKHDLTIWTGQIIRTKVSNVQGAGKFYIQIPTVTGQPAGQNQLVESYLFNVTPSSQVDNTLKKMIEGKDAIALIKIANNERFAVQLYDASGNRIKILDSDATDSVSPVCPLPIFTTNDQMWVSHIENGENIWLQRSSDLDKIAELLSSLYEYYSISGTLLVPEVTKLCVAEAEDQNWYRASIESVKETAAVLRFIDYGNTEEVPFDKIKALEQQFHVPHEMSLKVSLLVGLKGTDDEQKTLLHKQLDEKEFTTTFYNVNSKWLVELSENGAKISETLSKQGAVIEEKNTGPEQQEIPEMIVGNRYEVFLSYSDSPAQFWLQRNEEIDAIEMLQANLQEAAASFSPIVGIPEEGALCAALYSADGMWYRAEVLDADEDITTVRFVDYGNTDVVDSNSNNIKELPQSWRSIKKYGLKSRLDLIPTGSEDWSAASCEMFENMATASSDPITALIIADSVPRRVELFVGEKSVGDALVTAGHAIMVHNAEDLIDEIVDRELDPRAAFVSHVNSPSEFWVQEEKSVSDLEIMTDRFIVAEMFPKLEEISPGVLCVAKFPDDEQWYRARVNSHGVAGTQVLYIDYGNSAVSTEVRTIPDDLAAIPPLSRKCRLQLPPGVKEWSAKACDKFVDLAADGATIFLLDVIKDEETSVVGLTLEDSDVAEQLAELCDLLPVIDERLPPLGEENPPNVLVSHVNSPAEFWTQAESSIAELEIMASRLVDAQSLLPLNTFEKGTICAAKFPEDGEWYRAKIIAHDETGTNVLYFDYGSSALTTELRILPEDVANIPSLATRCALALPEDVESWSKEACDKFVELVADGVTMFQFEILGTEDPSMISLQIDGKDVVEILRPLCEKKKSSTISDEVTIEPTKTIVAVESTTFQENQEKEKANGMPENATEIIATHKTENVVLESEKIKEKESDDACNGGEIQTDNLIVAETEITQINGSHDSCKDKGVETDNSEIWVTEKLGTEIQETPHETEQASATVSDVVFDTKEVGTNGSNNTSHPAPAAVESADLLKTESAPDLSKTRVETKVKDEQENISAEITKPCSAIQETEPPAQISVTTAELIPEIKLEPEAELQTPGAKIVTKDPICITDHSDKPVPVGKEELKVVTVVEDAPAVAAKEVETLKELTVDEIVEKMVKTALVEVGDKVHDEEKVPEVISGCDDSIKGETGSSEEPLNNESAGTPQKTLKAEKIVPGSISRGSMDDGIPPSPLARRRSSCTDEKIVPGSINKGNDLSRAQSTDSLHQEMENADLVAPRVEAKEEPAPPTPGKCQHEDKIVPGSISRGESPSVEHARPVTPKTPHSEKLLAGVVNLQENLPDFEEQDEILTVEVEDNIPKYSL